MSVSDICTKKVVTADRGTSVADAAGLMRKKHVDYLVVTDVACGSGAPIGVVTDGDIVVNVTALGIDPHSLKVGDIANWEPLIASQDDDINDTVQRMHGHGVRWLPVVGLQGDIVGVLSLNDVIEYLLKQLSDISSAARAERDAEQSPKVLRR